MWMWANLVDAVLQTLMRALVMPATAKLTTLLVPACFLPTTNFIMAPNGPTSGPFGTSCCCMTGSTASNLRSLCRGGTAIADLRTLSLLSKHVADVFSVITAQHILIKFVDIDSAELGADITFLPKALARVDLQISIDCVVYAHQHARASAVPAAEEKTSERLSEWLFTLWSEREVTTCRSGGGLVDPCRDLRPVEIISA
ncbi:hypothetical protein OPT61_g5850 [Boeremia exigua]|uniref:Uncharacterized protein n=1 Tax=Boeremia exigua TaxID=749465 RepID=A0ACC2I930_9PLEO|nr:hypothetical protein OPT61_g5850 [Boeremia exigua]